MLYVKREDVIFKFVFRPQGPGLRQVLGILFIVPTATPVSQPPAQHLSVQPLIVQMIVDSGATFLRYDRDTKSS